MNVKSHLFGVAKKWRDSKFDELITQSFHCIQSQILLTTKIKKKSVINMKPKDSSVCCCKPVTETETVLDNSFCEACNKVCFNNDVTNVDSQPTDWDFMMNYMPCGVTIPDYDNAVQDLRNGPLSFSGQFEYGTIYSNKNFTGKSSAYFSLKSNSNGAFTVTLYRHNSDGSYYTVDTVSIPKPAQPQNGVSVGKTFMNLSSSGRYFLGFSVSPSASIIFSGSVT